MKAGGHPMISAPIGMMRHEHDHHGERLAQLEALTGECVVPEGACASWQALYVGMRKLIDDVREHVHLENNVLFRRFGACGTAEADDGRDDGVRRLKSGTDRRCLCPRPGGAYSAAFIVSAPLRARVEMPCRLRSATRSNRSITQSVRW